MKLAVFCIPALALIFFSSCNQVSNNAVAIKDFDDTLQPRLTKIVTAGIITYDSATTTFIKQIDDKQLVQLSESDQPMLRALALKEMLSRKSFDHFNLMMTHLDDTAIVVSEEGEWGLQFKFVSDFMLEQGKWKDTTARNKTIEEIVLKHNYLAAAYNKLPYVQLKPEYYNSIKEMAMHDGNFPYGTLEKENALYALATFSKKEDIPVIKQLLYNFPRMAKTSSKLMQNYRDTSYIEMLERCYPKTFYRIICREGSVDDAESFINSVAVYKNERSEKILRSILSHKPFVPCLADTASLMQTLVKAIWSNKCDAYSELRKQVAATALKYEEQEKQSDSSGIENESIIFPQEPSTEPVTWWDVPAQPHF